MSGKVHVLLVAYSDTAFSSSKSKSENMKHISAIFCERRQRCNQLIILSVWWICDTKEHARTAWIAWHFDDSSETTVALMIICIFPSVNGMIRKHWILSPCSSPVVLPYVMLERVAFLLFTCEVSSSNLVPDTGCPDRYFVKCREHFKLHHHQFPM